MANPRHLPRAPIVEAVIDFRTRTASTLRLEGLADLGPTLLDSYPGKPAEINLLELAFRQEPGKKTTGDQIDHGKVGYRFTSGDNKYVVQLRKDGFTISRLAPYIDWETFLAEASRMFFRYCEVSEVEAVHRMGVRYINRLPLPASEVGDFSGFLTAPPPFPREIQAFMNHFLTQVQVQEADTLAQATVTQTVQQGQQTSEHVPVILDVDVFQNGNFSVKPAVLLAQLAPLRAFKNRLFFASITEKTADLFS
jgi:uncharacterized protein (TIGR04255 family)